MDLANLVSLNASFVLRVSSLHNKSKVHIKFGFPKVHIKGGWPKSGFIFVRPASRPATLPADRLTLKSWDKGGKEKKRKRGGKEERRKDIKWIGGKNDRPRVDLEGGPAQHRLFI